VTQTDTVHPSRDKYLAALSLGDELLPSFVRSFPGSTLAQGDPSWLENWFRARSQHYFEDATAEPPDQLRPPPSLADAIAQAEGIATSPCILLEFDAHYFRGFRTLPRRVYFSHGLTVVDGPNTSGKTSLAEALEWLFTGELLRRTLHGQGAPRELEDCICNQLRPAGESTWVEATFQLADEQSIILRRVLVSDYGSTLTSKPMSKLYRDGVELSPDEEVGLLDAMVAGIPPLLMQHSLRVFVQSSPSERRTYFERLLRLDEVTSLVERAVIGDARLPDFPSPTGGVALAKWQRLKSSTQERSSRSSLTRVERAVPISLREAMAQALLSVGKAEFPDLLQEVNNLDEAITMVSTRQRERRQEAFPLLVSLRPRTSIDDQLLETISSEPFSRCLDRIVAGRSALAALEAASRQITDAEIAIANAFSLLSSAQIIAEAALPSTCPLCAYQQVPTLTADRIRVIRSWGPARDARTAATQSLAADVEALRQRIADVTRARTALLPAQRPPEEWHAAVQAAPPSIAAFANQLHNGASAIAQSLGSFDDARAQLASILASPHLTDQDIASLREATHTISSEAPALLRGSREYAQLFSELEASVAALSREDPAYGSREAWLDVASDQETTATDILWEAAKAKAQRELASLRQALIQSRNTILEARRQQLGEGITAVWRELREDTYSVFSRLYIPEPRGRGFPVEIEVKAVLDDGTQQREVDALRVFSESQVHALGIAAFVTRSALLGHRTVILDDPVQSMDEDHFRTFAGSLLPYLVGQGLQVIVLTHNDTFSRDVSHAFSDAQDYTTMSIRHSRREGCLVDEGNRRASERLKRAEDLGEEGRFQDAWRHVRLAMERIYLVAMLKYGGEGFDPKAWHNQTADFMWKSGTEDVISRIAPEGGPRLRDILALSVAGAHDKAPPGHTDLTQAIRDLRQLLTTLRLGSG